MEKETSKQIKKTPPAKQKPLFKPNFNHIEYFNEIKEYLNDYKILELREIAKYNKIKGAKSKQEYIQKINDHFLKIVNVIKIQKVCRGFFVRYFFKIKGGINAFKNRHVCVNETDFYTLEPISEITFPEFFIFKENSNQQNETQSENQQDPFANIHPTESIFYYGFNVNSLISMYKKNGTIINPYNRKTLPIETIQNIFSHYQLLSILFKEHTICQNSIDNIIAFKIPTKKQIRKLFTPSNVNNNNNNNNNNNDVEEIQMLELEFNNMPVRTLLNTIFNSVVGQPHGITNSSIQSTEFETFIITNLNLEQLPRIHNDSNYEFETFVINENIERTNEQNDQVIELENIRQKMLLFKQQPLNTRINELFMYIDQLGNYTNSSWFLELNKRKYYLFYSQLRELWTFRAQIPSNIKNKICPLGDPFLQSSCIFRKPYDQITDDEICKGCLDVIENIIMTSLDVEYRKIGCLHVLTALTVVSPDSRIQYNYLFELLQTYGDRNLRW